MGTRQADQPESNLTWQPAPQYKLPVPQKPALEQHSPALQKYRKFGAPQEPSLDTITPETRGDADGVAAPVAVEEAGAVEVGGADTVAVPVAVNEAGTEDAEGDGVPETGDGDADGRADGEGDLLAYVPFDGMQVLQRVSEIYELSRHAIPRATACHGPYDAGERGSSWERHWTNPSAQVDTACRDGQQTVSKRSARLTVNVTHLPGCDSGELGWRARADELDAPARASDGWD